MAGQTTQSPADILYTVVDEAPQLASGSLLPIIQAFTKVAGITVGTKDISLAGRILANFPEYLTEAQRRPDDLAELGALVVQPEANVIKLPNVSASLPQLKAAIAELQGQGFQVPDYPDAPKTDAEVEARARYDKIKGSAVNPVLREGNSDRRAPLAVKAYAQKNPHKMGAWSPDSKTHVVSMKSGDFFSNEKSMTIDSGSVGTARIEFVDQAGAVTPLKEKLPLVDGEVIDATFMSVRALRTFLAAQMKEAKEQGVLFSLHMKATMMKVSDPILFGHAVVVYFQEVFDKHAQLFAELGVDPSSGWGDALKKIQTLPEGKRAEIEADIQACMAKQPDLYMVDSDRGITNLHVPSDIIIDASMPAMIRAGGKGWDANGKARDTKAVIPDSSYSGVYDATVEFCKKHGAFNPATMGSIPNVGLMAQKAEEYGSHNQTFKAPGDGTIRVVSAAGRTLFSHAVEAGDVWRLCQAKDAAIQDWVKLAVNRARATGWPAVFWLDQNRPHDAELINKVQRYLKNHDTTGLDIRILSPVEATRFSLERMHKGENTISVTGNVLRDYLTDLFPILEVGTSAKMLSIVPLMNGGGLFETGAGGSAPKHVQQFVEEGHLRWDSLGEFCALAASLEHLSAVRNNKRAALLAKTLDQATGLLLDNNKSPGREVGELDNRGSHFYIAMYWAQALAAQSEDAELQRHFAPIARQMVENEAKILAEFNALGGKAIDLGGYYHTDPAKVAVAMRSSPTLNAIVASI
ncbi:MAG: NADP-dependent isocitrate dehydrogenase [Magnetococcales bacterium]|nr:NADP-dependent isocitrate dehydrogenase [Magnetococcales bacterium]